MPYEQYRGDALEAIGQVIFFQRENLSDVYKATSEQAKEVFLWYVSTYIDSELALFQEAHGLHLQVELPALWPVFLCDLSLGRV